MSPTITSGFQPSSRIASAPPSTATSTGRKSRTYERTILRSRLCPGPRATTSACRSRKLVRSVGKSGPCARSRPLLAQVAHGVVGEGLERLRHAALLLRERRLELVRLERPAGREARAVPEEARAADGEPLAVGDRRRRALRPSASISRTPPRTSCSGPGFGKRPVCDGATLTTTRTPDSTSSSAETRSRSVWSMIAMSPGSSRRTSSFVRLPSFAAPRVLDDAHCSAARNSRPPSIRSSSSRRCASSSSSIRVCVGSPGIFSTR